MSGPGSQSLITQLTEAFDEDEIVVILEIARVSLRHPDIYGKIAEEMDVLDDELLQYRNRLWTLLNDREGS